MVAVTTFDVDALLREVRVDVQQLKEAQRRFVRRRARDSGVCAMSPTMNEVDLVVTGGQIVSPGTYSPRRRSPSMPGKSSGFGAPDQMPPARERIDASGLHLLPGAIDVHVHFREPGFSHKETWTSATQAAAVGGVTTVFDMPNTNPPTSNVEALLQKLEIAQRQAIVDFGIYGNIGENNLDQLKPMAQAGAVSFKLYMGSENPLVRTAPFSTHSRFSLNSACAAPCMPRTRRSCNGAASG